mgnify:CR=1 FL=1
MTSLTVLSICLEFQRAGHQLSWGSLWNLMDKRPCWITIQTCMLETIKEKGGCEMHFFSSVLCVWFITVRKYLWIPSLELLPNQIPTCQGYRVIVSKMSLTKNGHIFMQKKLMIANLGTCEYQCIFKIKNILVCTFYFRLRRKFEFRSMAINYKSLNLICFSDMI